MYEIPQELQYKEKIVFNLNFEQLGYASLFVFVSIAILKTRLNFSMKLSIIIILGIIASLFMFFGFNRILMNYISWINFRDINFMTYKMNKFFSLHYLSKDFFETRLHKNRIISRLRDKKPYATNKIAIIKIFPINFSIKNKEEKDFIILNFQKFLNSLDFPVQMLIKTEPLNLDSYFFGLESEIKKEYVDLFNDYKKNIIELIKDNKVMNKSFYLVIKETSNLDTQVNICLERLRLLKLRSYRMNESQILGLLKSFFIQNSPKEYSNDVSKLDYFNYLVSPNNIKNRIDHLIIDSKFYRVIAVHGYPRNVRYGFLDRIITSSGNYDISLHIDPMPIESTIVAINKELHKQRSDLYSLRKKEILNTSLEIKYKDTKKILEDLQRGSEKLFNVSLYVSVTADSKEELDLLTKKIESELNSLLIIPKVPLFSIHNGLLSIMPLSKNSLDFKRNITSGALSAFFPFTSKFLDIDDKGVLLGVNKNNIPIIKDLYSLGNSNGFILSSSGFGKSFYAKLYIIRQLLIGTKIFVIDPQAEYLKLAFKFKGQVITISKDSPTIINPLDLMGHDYAEKRISLMDLFNVMLGGISDIQKAVIDKSLTICYNKKGITIDPATWNKGPPILEDLLKELVFAEKRCSLTEKPTYNSLINRLSMYVDGVFAFVNKHTRIDFNRDFIVFNIGEMPRQVKPVIMFLILDYVYMKMHQDKNKKLLVIDEAWSLLNRVEEASYIFEIVKTSRKHNLSLLLITQDVLDLIDSKAGNAILSNSSYILLFSQKPAVIESVAKTFHLSPGEKELLMTSKIGNGLIIMDHEHSEIRVVSSKEEYELITTNPNDKIIEETPKEKFKEISLDLEKRFYVKNKLSKEEVEYLLYNDYVISSHVGLEKGRQNEYLLKPYSNESSAHFFLSYAIFDYVKRFTSNVSFFNTIKPDIVFQDNKKRNIAIEVETGSYIYKKEFLKKVERLNKNYDDWFFVLTDRHLKEKYQKYGLVILRNGVVDKINEYFIAKEKPSPKFRLKMYRKKDNK